MKAIAIILAALALALSVWNWSQDEVQDPVVKLNTVVMEDTATANELKELNSILEEMNQEQKDNNAAQRELLEDIRRNYYMTIAP